MFKFVKYLLGAGLIAGSTTVAAAGGLPPEVLDSVMASCRPDYHRLCSFVVPGDGRAGRCLLDHETELAPPCLKSIKLAYAMEACMPDYRRFCNGVPPGSGQIVECLASRIEALLPECQRVVSANAPYAGHERYSSYRGPYGGPAPNAEVYSYEPRPSEAAPDPGEGANGGHAYDDRYADRGYGGYNGQPYGDGRYPDQGYNNPGYPQSGPGYPQPGPAYQQPGNSYPPAEEAVPLK
jgi:hypothetical protein